MFVVISLLHQLTLCWFSSQVMHCGTINFSRLVKLSICPSGPDWLTPLVLLLGNAPQVKEFLVDSVRIRPLLF